MSWFQWLGLIGVGLLNAWFVRARLVMDMRREKLQLHQLAVEQRRLDEEVAWRKEHASGRNTSL